jgi:hypothetical protein
MVSPLIVRQMPEGRDTCLVGEVREDVGRFNYPPRNTSRQPLRRIRPCQGKRVSLFGTQPARRIENANPRIEMLGRAPKVVRGLAALSGIRAGDERATSMDKLFC